MNDDSRHSSYSDSIGQPIHISSVPTVIETYKPIDARSTVKIASITGLKPETEMTFGDFTESELEARNLAKRVNNLKTQFKDLNVPPKHEKKRTNSDDGSELEV